MSTVPFFYQHFHDLSGKLAAAGSMYVFEAGSPIPKPIFSDEPMSIPQQNPMALDGNGVAPPWFVGEGLVDIKVYAAPLAGAAAPGALIFTALNISGAGASGQDPFPTPTASGYLYFNETTGIYSWVANPSDHLVSVESGDAAGYLGAKLLNSPTVQWTPVAVSPGNYAMQAAIPAEQLAGDHKSMVDATDTTPGYLATKLVAGQAVTLTVENEGWNETLQIASSDHFVGIDANDTTPGFLAAKLQAGSGITLTTEGSPGNETLQVAAQVQNGDRKVVVDSSDTTPAFLGSKLAAGTGITLTVENVGGNEEIQIASTIQGADHKVSVDSNDTTPGFLAAKLLAGANVTLSIEGSPGNEQIQIAAAAPTVLDHKVAVDSTDTTPGLLASKLQAGQNITLQVENQGANEIIQINAAVTTLDHKVLTDSADTVPDFLAGKIIGGPGVSVGTYSSGSNDQVKISSQGKVLVDGNDQQQGLLAAKLLAGAGINLTVQNPGANELLLITATASVLDHKVLVDSTDTTPGLLASKLQAGDSFISFTKANPGGNEIYETLLSIANLVTALTGSFIRNQSVTGDITPDSPGNIDLAAGAEIQIASVLSGHTSVLTGDSISFQSQSFESAGFQASILGTGGLEVVNYSTDLETTTYGFNTLTPGANTPSYGVYFQEFMVNILLFKISGTDTVPNTLSNKLVDSNGNTFPEVSGPSGHALQIPGKSGVNPTNNVVKTFDRALCVSSLQLPQNGYSCYLTSFIPDSDTPIAVGTNVRAIQTQTGSGSINACIFDSNLNRIAYCTAISNPGNGQVLFTIANVSANVLSSGAVYYFGLLHNMNSPYYAGIASSSMMNGAIGSAFPPIAWKVDNIGSLIPPTTLSGGSESLLRIYGRIG